MPQINEQQAKEFLDSITLKDKIAIIHHDDLDGFASGILLYDFCKSKGCEVEEITLSIEKRKLGEMCKNLEKFNKILISDIPPYFICFELEELKEKETLYIDHHQKDTGISKHINELRTPKDKYIPASKTCYEITEDKNRNKKWLAVAGTIADYGFAYKENEDFINNFLKEEKVSLEDYKQNVVYIISNLIVYFKLNPKKVFELLENIKSWKNLSNIKKYSDEVNAEIKRIEEDFEKNKEKFENINFYLLKSKFHLRSIIISSIASKKPEEMFICFTKAEEDKNRLNISARHQKEGADVISLLKSGIKDLENASVGGHLRAGGGFIQAKDLQKFKENIKNYLKKHDTS